MTPIEKLVPEIVKKLLKTYCKVCGDTDHGRERKWDEKDHWLASLVVGIVEKEADLCNVSHYEVNGRVGGHSCTKGALSRFNISQADYEEIKRRVEK